MEKKRLTLVWNRDEELKEYPQPQYHNWDCPICHTAILSNDYDDLVLNKAAHILKCTAEGLRRAREMK